MKPIIKKIYSLIQKTVANGCTEAEARAAKEKAAQLMAKHQIDSLELEKVDMAGKEFAEQLSGGQWKEIPTWNKILFGSVADYCSCLCRVVRFHSETGERLDREKDELGWSLATNTGRISVRCEFLGTPGDIQNASELYNLIVAEIEKETSRYPGGRKQKGDFRYGMAMELASRLSEMKERQNELMRQAGAAGALVLKKRDEIFDHYELGKRASVPMPNRKGTLAVAAGMGAGARVDLNKKVGS